jgi:hypothetical protein
LKEKGLRVQEKGERKGKERGVLAKQAKERKKSAPLGGADFLLIHCYQYTKSDRVDMPIILGLHLLWNVTVRAFEQT